jgi:predicted PurR-regulated permease PerM
MPAEMNHPKRSRWLAATLFLTSAVLTICILYFGRALLIPLALAILLSFILSPVVTKLRRWGAGRILSVIITVVLTLTALASIGTMITLELKRLANELPAYRQNIRQKISDIRSASKSESLHQVKAIAQEIIDEFKQEETPAFAQKNNPDAPVVVTEEKTAATTSSSNNTLLDSMLEQLSSAGLVIILVIFMLLRREDLRDRLLHLAGCENLVMTTKAIEEVSDKVSRYLVRQCLLNTIFGVGIAIGLSLIGLPYAILWGFLAGTARFIPYIGPVLGAVAPIVMSLAVFDSWGSPLIVISLILGWELLNNMVLEPVLYGQGIGVSEVALLVMMAFWTWLWGALGLVLAAPLTVCLVVISKSVPGLEFISKLLDSKPALARHHAFYQRLIAQQHDEAMELVRDYLAAHTNAEFFTSLCLPVLETCRRDHAQNRLAARELKRICQMLRQILTEIHGRPAGTAIPPGKNLPHALIIGCPVQDEVDELVLLMLAELLAEEHCYMPVLSAELTETEKLAEIASYQPTALCLGYLVGTDGTHYTEFRTQIHQRCPQLPIVAATKANEKTTGLPTDLLIATSSFTEAKQELLAHSAIPPEAGDGTEIPAMPPVLVTA